MESCGALLRCVEESEYDAIPLTVRSKIKLEINSRICEFDELKGKYEKLRINTEQQYINLEKQLVDTNSRLENKERSNDEYQAKLSDIEMRFNTTKNSLQEEEEKLNLVENKKKELLNSNELLQLEKHNLNDILLRREQDNERLKDDIKEMNDKISRIIKEKCDAQAELMKVQASDTSREYKERRILLEKEQLEKQVGLLNAQLSERNKEFISFRRDKASTLLQLQGSVEEKTEEIKYLKATIEALKSSKDEQGSKIENLAQKLKDARDVQMKVEEQYRQELSAQAKLANLYKTSSEENNDKITELSRGVEHLQKLFKDATSAYTELESTKSADIALLEENATEMDLKIKKLEQELHNANEMLAAKKSGKLSISDEDVGRMYPTAAATSRLLTSGMTLTQIYTEYINAVEMLETQKQENAQLNSYLNQILQEIEDKAPLLRKQREDYETTLQSLNQLTPQLDTVMLECEKLRSGNEDVTRHMNFFKRENARLQQSNVDLSRQVRFLLAEVQEAKGGCVVSKQNEDEVSSSEDMSSSSRVITEKLVTFRSISELQEKNHQLLESLRDLSKVREDDEISACDKRVGDLQLKLEEAFSELEHLRSDRKRHAEMVESIVRQRDMYRVLLQHGGSTSFGQLQPISSTPLVSTSASLPAMECGSQKESSVELEKSLQETKLALKELHAEHNAYMKEKMKHERMLNEQLDQMRNTMSEFRIKNARLSSQVDHTTERYKILQSNADGYRKEIAALQDRCQRYSTSVAKHELTISTLKEDVFEKQQLASTWEAKVDQMQSRYDLSRANEQRLQAEIESIRRERQSQALLNANLQAIQNNLERAEFESKTGHTNHVDSLEKELTFLRQKVHSLEEDKSSMIKSVEKKLSSVQAELSASKASNDQLVIELGIAQKEKQSSMQELADVEAKLSAVENKLSKLEATDLDMPAEEEIKDLKNEINSLRQHLKNTHMQLKMAKQQVEQFKTISDGVEGQLKESNEVTSKVKETCEAKISEAVNAKAALEERVEQLEKDHQELLKENIRITENNHCLNIDLRTQLSSLQLELQEALQTRDIAVADQAEAKQVLKEQVMLASGAQDNYQRELILHAADVDALSTVKKQLESHGDDVAQSQAETKTEQLKFLDCRTSWHEQELVMREENRHLESRCSELEEQNKLLHTQMESLTNQVLAIHRKASDEPVCLSLSEDVTKSNEQLLEVIRFLRREKEIAETKLEVSDTATSHLQQSVSLLQKQLEEAKESLFEERMQNQASVQAMSEHLGLMQKVETVNLLQTTNRLLRDENQRMRSQLQESETKILRLESDIDPLQAAVRETKAQNEALEVDKKMLASETERFKSHIHNLVEQTSKTDPEEHKKLLQEKDLLRKQLAQTKEQLFRAKAELSRLLELLASKESNLSTQKQDFIKQLEELKEVKTSLDDEQKEKEKNTTTINQLKKIGRKYKEQSEAVQKELDTLKSKLSSQQLQETAATVEMDEASNRMNVMIVCLEKQVDELKVKSNEREAEVISLNEKLEARQQEVTERLAEISKLQSDNVEMEKKVSQSRLVLANCRSKITQQKDHLDRLMAENRGLKTRLSLGVSDVVGQTNEHVAQAEQQVSLLKSQHDQQMAQLQHDLTEAMDGAKSAGASVEQVQQANDRLVVENQELQSKVQHLQRQMDMMPKAAPAQSTQPLTRTVSGSGASPTAVEMLKMASIKPVASATGSPAVQHALSQAKATASIRPMAITPANASGGVVGVQHPSASSTPPIVTVMPTTVVQLEVLQDDQPSTSGLQQQPTSSFTATSGRPQQQVQIVTPQIDSSVDSSTTVEEPVQAVIVPSVQESLHATQFIGQQPHALTATSSGIAYAGPSTSNPDHQIVFGKRLHDDVDVTDDIEAKRSKVSLIQVSEEVSGIDVVPGADDVTGTIEVLSDSEEDESDGDDSYRDVKGLSGEVCTVVGEMGDDVVIIDIDDVESPSTTLEVEEMVATNDSSVVNVSDVQSSDNQASRLFDQSLPDQQLPTCSAAPGIECDDGVIAPSGHKPTSPSSIDSFPDAVNSPCASQSCFYAVSTGSSCEQVEQLECQGVSGTGDRFVEVCSETSSPAVTSLCQPAAPSPPLPSSTSNQDTSFSVAVSLTGYGNVRSCVPTSQTVTTVREADESQNAEGDGDMSSVDDTCLDSEAEKTKVPGRPRVNFSTPQPSSSTAFTPAAIRPPQLTPMQHQRSPFGRSTGTRRPNTLSRQRTWNWQVQCPASSMYQKSRGYGKGRGGPRGGYR